MLPTFKRIALVGFAVNAPFVAVFLLLANVKMAVSLLAGYGLALAIYGLLYAIIGRGLDLFAAESGVGPGQASSSISATGFVIVMMAKYVIIVGLLYLLWRTGYMDVRPFLGGFILAQIGITWMSVSHSKKLRSGSV